MNPPSRPHIASTWKRAHEPDRPCSRVAAPPAAFEAPPFLQPHRPVQTRGRLLVSQGGDPLSARSPGLRAQDSRGLARNSPPSGTRPRKDVRKPPLGPRSPLDTRASSATPPSLCPQRLPAGVRARCTPAPRTSQKRLPHAHRRPRPSSGTAVYTDRPHEPVGVFAPDEGRPIRKVADVRWASPGPPGHGPQATPAERG